MELEQLVKDCAIRQKKGLHFILLPYWFGYWLQPFICQDWTYSRKTSSHSVAPPSCFPQHGCCRNGWRLTLRARATRSPKQESCSRSTKCSTFLSPCGCLLLYLKRCWWSMHDFWSTPDAFQLALRFQKLSCLLHHHPHRSTHHRTTLLPLGSGCIHDCSRGDFLTLPPRGVQKAVITAQNYWAPSQTPTYLPSHTIRDFPLSK